MFHHCPASSDPKWVCDINKETPIYFLFVFILRHSLFTTSSWHKIDRAIVSECNKIGSTHPIKHHDVSFSFEKGRRGEREGEVREGGEREKGISNDFLSRPSNRKYYRASCKIYSSTLLKRKKNSEVQIKK